MKKQKDPEDKIRLDKTLFKEKWQRDLYVKWVTIIKKRMDSGLCPKCGSFIWIQRGSGFQKKWICDKCGLSTTRADWHTGQIWWDYIKFYAIEEIRRIEKMARTSQEIKNYERDQI